MNKTMLSIAALVLVAATTAMGIYAMAAAQDAQARCNNGSICQSNRQHSSIRASIIDHSDVSNQAASNSITVGSAHGHPTG